MLISLFVVVVVDDVVVVVVVVGVFFFSFFIDQSGDCFLCSVRQGLFFLLFFLSLACRPTE